MYEEKINAYFDAPERRAELVEAISRLVRIRSVREEPLPGMPFGPGPAAALAEGLKLAEELGFATRNRPSHSLPPGRGGRGHRLDSDGALCAQGGGRHALRPGHRR